MAAKVEVLNKWCDLIETDDQALRADLKDSVYYRDLFAAKYQDDLN